MNLSEIEKITHRLFPRFPFIQNISSELIQYKQNAITLKSKPLSTITILIVVSGKTLLGNDPFNGILNPLYSVCIAKISLPAQFYSISIFLYYSTPAGLTSERGPRYLCSPGGCGRLAIYTRPETETSTPA